MGAIRAIGVDEIQYGKGHKYLTLVYQIDLGCTRLLWIGKERTVKTFRDFFAMIGAEVSAKIEFVCSDMWKPYLGVIREMCPARSLTRPLCVFPQFARYKGSGDPYDAANFECAADRP